MSRTSRFIACLVVFLLAYLAVVLGVERWMRNSEAAPVTPQKVIAVQKRIILGLIAFGPVVICAAAGIGMLSNKSRDRGSETPWTAARAEMAGLTELARTSAAQGEALDRERMSRQLAEQDSAMKEQMLARSLDEKLRLGRDLHDGLIQSLYAAGLTLESARGLLRENPAEAERRLEKCLSVLNTAISDVRSFITGLKPEPLRSGSFAASLEAIVGDLRANRDAVFDLRVDEEASSQLTPAQEAESVQIVREAVSNSLRHGGADRITIRLHRTDREICLLVQDNGRGFDPARRLSGHGLGNMRARAEQLGAAFRIDSKPGEGSRVVLTFPTLDSA